MKARGDTGNIKRAEQTLDVVEKVQADVEANNKLRTQEKAAMAADANANQKQLIDSQKLVAKLESDAAATQKLLAKEKENVAKLQSDASETRKQLEQEKLVK